MDRPCFLVIDREYPGSISTRKLVIETAKFNVITAYDEAEALHALKRFPRVDGVVLNTAIDSYEGCNQLIVEMREIVPEIEIIVVSVGGSVSFAGKVHSVDSHDPKKLLDCLRSLRQEAADEILNRDGEVLQ